MLLGIWSWAMYCRYVHSARWRLRPLVHHPAAVPPDPGSKGDGGVSSLVHRGPVLPRVRRRVPDRPPDFVAQARSRARVGHRRHGERDPDVAALVRRGTHSVPNLEGFEVIRRNGSLTRDGIDLDESVSVPDRIAWPGQGNGHRSRGTGRVGGGNRVPPRDDPVLAGDRVADDQMRGERDGHGVDVESGRRRGSREKRIRAEGLIRSVPHRVADLSGATICRARVRLPIGEREEAVSVVVDRDYRAIELLVIDRIRRVRGRRSGDRGWSPTPGRVLK